MNNDEDTLPDDWYSGITPIHIVSPPGCGKSAAFEALARTLNMPLWSQISSQEDPVDTCGVIVPDHTQGFSRRLVPEYWLRACRAPWILAFDEITAGSQEQRTGIMRATDDGRTMAGHKLNKRTIVIAASNPPEMAAGSARELSAPELSRFRHRRIGPEPAVDWMTGGPGLVLFPRAVPAPSYPPPFVRIVGAYLKRNPGAALASAEEIKAAVEKQEPFACPRAWTRAAIEAPDDRACWGEYVGTAWAATFCKWYTLADLPDPLEIVNHGSKVVPKRGDGVMATAGAVQTVLGCKPSDKQLRNGLVWMKLAAEKGFAADCAMAIVALSRAMGEIRLSRLAELLAPFEKLLNAAAPSKPLQ